MTTKAKKEKLKINVEVTEAHIKKAQKLRNRLELDRESNCPVALALRGLRYRMVSVCYDNVSVTKGGKRFYGDLSKKVQKFISSFDDNNGKKCKPASLVLKLEA